ncbi:hypothetical protein GCM10022626_09530 [[Pseudomonas] carboxydohydrogena]
MVFDSVEVNGGRALSRAIADEDNAAPVARAMQDAAITDLKRKMTFIMLRLLHFRA